MLLPASVKKCLDRKPKPLKTRRDEGSLFQYNMLKYVSCTNFSFLLLMTYGVNLFIKFYKKICTSKISNLCRARVVPV